MKVTILGHGAWGSALAIHLCQSHSTTLWGRDSEALENIQRERENKLYLPGIPLPDNLILSTHLNEALLSAKLVIIATPIASLRSLLEAIHPLTQVPIIWACKGFEPKTGYLAHQIGLEILGVDYPCAVLSGPSFAQELAKGLPTAVTLAAKNIDLAQELMRELHHPRLRLYASEDIVGVEIAGAMKNIIAIAAGLSDGLQLGHNARAALITRGLAEISRLGVAMGGKSETFMGLSGLGDLVLTATGPLSRNYRVGKLLAEGQRLEAILKSLGHVAEGVGAALEVMRLANQYHIDLPISRMVEALLNEQITPQQALLSLLNREPKRES
ncbi:MAG: glycerol-3-phosphate dehydrogenase [Ferrovum sp. 37-45-19]|nr:MAG: glycerol-3-phosphate dehydrogenase [Ferrovum sp. 21-44-67]OYV95276.1 MAG: glycerol-3-phosphate dehydrogenase [Ferrovum sp. 37-45-19]HQU05992.1 NAD(P)H-dependent glycerol-3-phosphate dehydrogenase [Ferrovaceae bacterium]